MKNLTMNDLSRIYNYLTRIGFKYYYDYGLEKNGHTNCLNCGWEYNSLTYEAYTWECEDTQDMLKRHREPFMLSPCYGKLIREDILVEVNMKYCYLVLTHSLYFFNKEYVDSIGGGYYRLNKQIMKNIALDPTKYNELFDIKIDKLASFIFYESMNNKHHWEINSENSDRIKYEPLW